MEFSSVPGSDILDLELIFVCEFHIFQHFETFQRHPKIAYNTYNEFNDTSSSIQTGKNLKQKILRENIKFQGSQLCKH
jgi:hypothetical protein